MVRNSSIFIAACIDSCHSSANPAASARLKAGAAWRDVRSFRAVFGANVQIDNTVEYCLLTLPLFPSNLWYFHFDSIGIQQIQHPKGRSENGFTMCIFLWSTDDLISFALILETQSWAVYYMRVHLSRACLCH